MQTISHDQLIMHKGVKQYNTESSINNVKWQCYNEGCILQASGSTFEVVASRVTNSLGSPNQKQTLLGQSGKLPHNSLKYSPTYYIHRDKLPNKQDFFRIVLVLGLTYSLAQFRQKQEGDQRKNPQNWEGCNQNSFRTFYMRKEYFHPS